MTALGAVLLPQLPQVESPVALLREYLTAQRALLRGVEITTDGRYVRLDAGADTVVLQPTADDPDPEGFIRFGAEDVRPLVK